MKYLITGIGNPGEKYSTTRHNIGFMAVDFLVRGKDVYWTYNKKFKANLIEEDEYCYMKPDTYMNESGWSVAKVCGYYRIIPENLLIIHDDVDLSFLSIKKQFGAGSAGHHGVESVVNYLGTKAFWRIRVGIGRPQEPCVDVEDWVLMSFMPNELLMLEKRLETIEDLIRFA